MVRGFNFKQVFAAFVILPRVLRLVWSAGSWSMIVSGALSLLQGLLPTANIWVAGLIIDGVVKAIQVHSVDPLWWPIGLQLGLTLLTSGLTAFASIVQQTLQTVISNHVQTMILEKANTLDLAFFENPEFYDKLRRASDQATFQPMNMISQAFDIVQNVVTFCSLIVLLLHLVWWLALLSLFGVIPAFIQTSRYGWKGYMLMRGQSSERRMMFYLTNLLTTDTYNKEIKLFNLGNFFIERFKKLAQKLYKENRKLIVGRSLSNFAWTGLPAIINIFIYFYVALQAIAGRISLGGLTIYTQASTQMGGVFLQLLVSVAATYQNSLYMNLLFEFLEYQPKIVSPTQPQPLASAMSHGLSIEFCNVSFTYPSKDTETHATLKNISFTIQAGESIALVGLNGAGKTTLVKLLSRLYDPDEGTILIGGRNIKEYDLEELHNQIGVIFQDYVNYHMSAGENIGVGRIAEIANHELVTSAANKSGADAVIERLTQGYETMLGRWFDQGTQLSGGEWQKIAIARAFMRDAHLLILDEPTSALDAQAEYNVFTRFRALTEGKTTVFISHRFSTVRLAQRILVLEHGTILEQGSHEQLMRLGGRYAALFNLQAEAYRS